MMTIIDHLQGQQHLITKRQAADFLGVSCKTVHRRIRSGQLRTVRINTRAVRIDPADLAQYVSLRQLGGYAHKSNSFLLSSKFPSSSKKAARVEVAEVSA